MIRYEKEYGFRSMIREGLDYISQIVSRSIFSKVGDGAEILMNRIDNRIIRIERRIMRRLYSLILIVFGGLFLALALFSLMKEFLGLSSTLAYFFIGMIILLIGIMLKIGRSERRIDG